MTAAKSFDLPSPFAVKQEKDEDINDDDDNNEDLFSVSSLPQPSILDKDCFTLTDPSDEFLRLTSMVRRVYFSYLHKSVISNYNVCCETKEKGISKSELKKFASQMELCAVRASLEASLYRQTMLKMIADMKSTTMLKKVHKKLKIFLETPPNKVDMGIQTGDDYASELSVSDSLNSVKDVHIQSAFVTSNFDENFHADVKTTDQKMRLDDRISDLLKVESRLSPKPEKSDEKTRVDQKTNKIKVKVERPKNSIEKTEIIPSRIDVTAADVQLVDNQIADEMQDIFGDDTKPVTHKNDDEASQDSLMQHLEDMFCESDDSSDLMTLIEKHSGVSKENIDSEIVKMCPIEASPPRAKQQPQTNSNVSVEDKNPENSTTKRKLSFSNYKKMKKRAMGDPETPPLEETSEDRHARRARGIWFVERVHQVSRLKVKMMELSVRNYRKHGRLRIKFIELFGDSDEDDEMMPESPIHIEEHLTACRERIAPWVVKHLMPFYSKRIIVNRLLFKAVAKHIADMLIIDNTFPEDDDVNAYIKDYFRNKTSIKAESDIYI